MLLIVFLDANKASRAEKQTRETFFDIVSDLFHAAMAHCCLRLLFYLSKSET